MKLILVIFSVIILHISCVKDIDTEQIKNATYTAPIELALLKVATDQSDFLDSSNYIIEYKKTFYIGFEGLFKDSKKDSLTHTMTLTNTFSDRQIRCSLTYTDKDDNPLLTDSFWVRRDVNSFTRILTYEGEDYENFVNTKYIYVRLQVGPSVIIVPPPLDGEFHMHSKIGFIIEQDIDKD